MRNRRYGRIAAIFELSPAGPAYETSEFGAGFDGSTLPLGIELSRVHALRMPSLETDAGGSLLRGQHDFVFARQPADRPIKKR